MGTTQIRKRAIGAVAFMLAATAATSAGAEDLGTIDFPTSGAPDAQPAFLEGVKALHNFQFDEAAVAFKEAQRLDPGFALAYWGEAMSYNHPLWAEQDTAAARAALERLAPTADGRAAKAELDKERAFIEAVEPLFFGSDDKLERDLAYAERMTEMHERWPGDHEIATFYALSLLGTVRPGDTGFRRQALAAAAVLDVFARNPEHPGAAHFIIHAFDDPEHAPLSLPAARAYAEIAPASAHALHMPSHIFVQLGLWEDVVASNIESYEAAFDLNRRMNLPEGRSDFHALSWMAYGNLMLGRYDDAEDNLRLAREAVERNPDSPAVLNGYLDMRARHILETGRWEDIELRPDDDGGFAATVPGLEDVATGTNGAWLYAAGVSAAHSGDLQTAAAAESQLERLADRREADGNAYAARQSSIMAAEIAAAAALADGRIDDAVRAASRASELEATLGAPSGPPVPIKPATELYGEILLAADRPAEAAAAFQLALLRMPKRSPSLLGLARAAEAAGDTATAHRSHSELTSMQGAGSSREHRH
jgi:tetratricopeptide (TPR) repeat protein